MRLDVVTTRLTPPQISGLVTGAQVPDLDLADILSTENDGEIGSSQEAVTFFKNNVIAENHIEVAVGKNDNRRIHTHVADEEDTDQGKICEPLAIVMDVWLEKCRHSAGGRDLLSALLSHIGIEDLMSITIGTYVNGSGALPAIRSFGYIPISVADALASAS
ncbi:hypothetical protein H2198_000736 [Neophaeococcomyces mojaviensis]|uniref:Uncharacterized protein n=1 Tax=Neophaeococcomyces mojaviensis TaxID=3383035 RepID=A0ACC3AJB3_9EURO|nr:hypothetical protein H2198_000736 [Knufia sp. JES_112]